MAKGFLDQRLKEEGSSDTYRVQSAGTWAVEGAPASGNSIHTMADYGIDLSSHRAHLLSREDIREADLVLVMEEAHREAITSQLPEEAAKIHLLSEVAGESGDIEDPYGLDLEAYRNSAAHLEALIRGGFRITADLAKGTAPD